MAEPLRKPELKLIHNGLTALPPPGYEALNRAIADFLQAKAGKAPKTVKFYENALYQFRKHVGAHSWPPTATAIDSFLIDCKLRGLRETTIDDYYRALRSWLNWLYKRGKIDANPIDLAERPPRPRPLPRAPNKETLKILFENLETLAAKGKGHWQDVRSLALWSLALDTGLRVGELSALAIHDLTLEKKRRSAFVRGAKTHEDRIVVFHKITAKDVKRWMKVRGSLNLPAGFDALFISDHHGQWQALTDSGMRQDLKERCLKLGIPHLTPHRFRNAYAVYAIRNRQNLLDVQRQMGHRHLSTTQRYTLVDDEGRASRHDEHSPRGKL